MNALFGSSHPPSVLDDTNILVISYIDENIVGHRCLECACPRTSIGHLSPARRARPSRPVGRHHWRAGRSPTVLVDVPCTEPTACGAHYAATHQPSTNL